MTVKKSSFCRLLNDTKDRLSVDRLRRFENNKIINGPLHEVMDVFRKYSIRIGDWCAFQHPKQNKKNLSLIVNLLSFRYLSSSSKSRKYTLDSAPTELPKGGKKRGLGCLCTFYELETNAQTIEMTENHELMVANRSSFIIDIKLYVSHIPEPNFSGAQNQTSPLFSPKEVVVRVLAKLQEKNGRR